MYYTCHYQSPLGGITMACDEEGLTGLWFDGQKYFGSGFLKEADPENREEKDTVPGNEQKKPPVLAQAEKWLDLYFAGRRPDFTPPLHLTGSDFRLAVWKLLLEIPLWTDNHLQRACPQDFGTERRKIHVSSRRQAARWGHNPVSIIVPWPTGFWGQTAA